MYQCQDCDAVFQSPVPFVERYGLDIPPYETLYGCPHCGGEAVELAECDSCHGAFEEEALQQGFCPVCGQEVAARFQALLAAHFNERERGLLNELYDGERF